jgi:hypothetical protein
LRSQEAFDRDWITEFAKYFSKLTGFQRVDGFDCLLEA